MVKELVDRYIKSSPLEKKLDILVVEDTPRHQESAKATLEQYANRLDVVGDFEGARYALENNKRSEERRVGKDCSEPCRFRWSPCP